MESKTIEVPEWIRNVVIPGSFCPDLKGAALTIVETLKAQPVGIQDACAFWTYINADFCTFCVQLKDRDYSKAFDAYIKPIDGVFDARYVSGLHGIYIFSVEYKDLRDDVVSNIVRGIELVTRDVENHLAYCADLADI